MDTYGVRVAPVMKEWEKHTRDRTGLLSTVEHPGEQTSVS